MWTALSGLSLFDHLRSILAGSEPLIQEADPPNHKVQQCDADKDGPNKKKCMLGFRANTEKVKIFTCFVILRTY